MRSLAAACALLALLAPVVPAAQTPERLPAGCLAFPGGGSGWLPDVPEGSGLPLPRDGRTAVIRGRITALGSGRPLQDAQVCVTTRTDLGWHRIVRTGGDGRFEVTGLGLGVYRLAASMEGYLTRAYGRRPPEGRVVPLQVMVDGGVIENVLLALPAVGN